MADLKIKLKSGLGISRIWPGNGPNQQPSWHTRLGRWRWWCWWRLWLFHNWL